MLNLNWPFNAAIGLNLASFPSGEFFSYDSEFYVNLVLMVNIPLFSTTD